MGATVWGPCVGGWVRPSHSVGDCPLLFHTTIFRYSSRVNKEGVKQLDSPCVTIANLKNPHSEMIQQSWGCCLRFLLVWTQPGHHALSPRLFKPHPARMYYTPWRALNWSCLAVVGTGLGSLLKSEETRTWYLLLPSECWPHSAPLEHPLKTLLFRLLLLSLSLNRGLADD